MTLLYFKAFEHFGFSFSINSFVFVFSYTPFYLYRLDLSDTSFPASFNLEF